MEKLEKQYVCDVCRAQKSASISLWTVPYNDTYPIGWFRLTKQISQTGFSGAINEKNHNVKVWDLCSEDCVAKLVANKFVIKTDDPTTFIKGHSKP
jgi:hypothetical protein